MSEEIDRLKRELRAYDAIFDLQRKRMIEATKLWQSETGQTCSPDLGQLLEWLMERAMPRSKAPIDLSKLCLDDIVDFAKLEGKR